MSGREGLRGFAPSATWTDEAFASWSRAGAAASAAGEKLAAAYADSLTELQRTMLDELAGASRAVGALSEIFAQSAGSLDEELSVGGGWGWSSVEAKAWARERVPGVRADEERVAGFWNGERVAPAMPAKFGRGGRRPSAVSSPRMQKVRLGPSVYAWVPDGMPADRMVAEGSRRPRQAVPGDVLEAERRLRAADEAAGEFVEMMTRLGHKGPVTGPGPVLGLGPGLSLVATEWAEGEEKTLTVESTDWKCEACGAETADEELFAELRCGP